MKSVHFIVAAAIAVAIGTGATSSRGGTADPALDFSSSSSTNDDTGYSMGYEFTVNQNLTVAALGYYDAGGVNSGLTSGHVVGIYNLSGGLLTSATVTSADPLTGHFRYAAISPISLTAGQSYFVVGVTGTTDDYAWGVNGLTVDPAITFLDTYYIASSTLAVPTTSNSDLYLAGSFELSGVPEPTSLALLGLGASILFARRRRIA